MKRRSTYGSDYGSKRVSVNKVGRGRWLATARHDSPEPGKSSTTGHVARTARGAYGKASRFLGRKR